MIVDSILNPLLNIVTYVCAFLTREKRYAGYPVSSAMGNRTSAPAERRDALSRDTPLSRAAARAVQLFPAALAYELAALRRGEKTAAISYRLRSPPQAYEPLVRGWVDKYSQGTETWRRRFCVIMPSGTLQYFDREVESGSPAAGSVDLVGYIVTDEMTATGEPVLRLASFIPGRRDYTFRFAFADERQTWKSALRCAIRAGVPPLSSMPGEASAFRRLIEVMRGDFGLDTTPRIDRREVDALASLFVHIAADTGVAGARNTITAATRAARTAAAGAWSVASSRADALRPALQRLLDANASAVANALSSSSATAVALVSAALKDTRIQEKSANHAEAVTMALLLPLCEVGDRCIMGVILTLWCTGHFNALTLMHITRSPRCRLMPQQSLGGYAV